MSASNDILDNVLDCVRAEEVPPFPRDQVIPAAIRLANMSALGPQPRSRATVGRPQYVLAAALLVIAVFAGLLWRVGPFSPTESFAFEQVLTALARLKSVRYTVTTTGWKGQPWPDPIIDKVVLLQPGMLRSEKDDEVQIFNSQAGRFLHIERKSRTATLQPLYPSADGKPASIQLDEFSERLRNIPATAKPLANRHTINGRAALPFTLKLDNDEYLVDVDVTTKLPLRMEVNHGKIGGKEIKEVVDDFVFDSPINPSLFELSVPQGYAVKEYIPDPNNKSYPKDDANDLVVTPGGIGPVKSGMRAEEIVRLLGKPDWINKVGPSPPTVVPSPDVSEMKVNFQELNYDSRGFQITINPGGFLSISCSNQGRGGPNVRDFVGRTAEGTRLGATREQVRKTYGEPEIDRPDALTYVALGWQFFFRNDRLCGIATNMPMPRHRTDGVQTRVLKDGSILETVPGVDIDKMIDKDGNLKKGPLKMSKEPTR
jgi:outer membrane lipoprotein-sorting protein